MYELVIIREEKAESPIFFARKIDLDEKISELLDDGIDFRVGVKGDILINKEDYQSN